MSIRLASSGEMFLTHCLCHHAATSRLTKVWWCFVEEGKVVTGCERLSLCLTVTMLLLLILLLWLLDQELIPYRYSSCSCSSCSPSSCWGDCLQSKPKGPRFKSDQDKIWQDCSSGEYASIDVVGFLIWRHTFKMSTMTSDRRSLLHMQQRPPIAR